MRKVTLVRVSMTREDNGYPVSETDLAQQDAIYASRKAVAPIHNTIRDLVIDRPLSSIELEFVEM